ncbi:lipopolysaccharide biosynthesis protein [Eubacterium maltosivorans]|uniref:lipopolysaccharide biosynthesis protein n=1 Tax=Eubacterium maltosivorans TaxID=2041044 RepID=UPI0018A0D4FA|nr:oligosaccharide flippase family protein [Eubacterium maltosivorans]
MSGSKVIKAGIGYTVGNILLKGIALFTLPIFGRILTTEEFGLFNVYVAYENIVTIFVGLCLYGSLRTAKYDYKDCFEQYVYNTIILSSGVFLAFLLIGNIGYNSYATIFGFSRSIMNLLIVHSYAMFMFQFYNVKAALHFEYKKYLVVSGLNSIFGTVLSIFLILFIFNSQKYIARILGYAIVPIIIGIVLWINMMKKSISQRGNKINFGQWKYSLHLCLPLVVHTFSQQILNQFDRIMIQKIVSASASGLYSFTQTFSNILYIITLSLDNAWSIWFYDQLNEKNYKIIKLKMKIYILMMSILYVGFISLAPDVMIIMGTEAYYEGISMIVPLSFSVFFMFLYSLPVHVEYFYKKTKFIALGTSAAAIINFILNYIGINIWGYTAAAWATLISYIILYVFHQIIAFSMEKEKIFPYKTIVSCTLLLLIDSAIVITNISNPLIRWKSMMVIIVVLGIVYKEILIEALQMIPVIKNIPIVKDKRKDEK